MEHKGQVLLVNPWIYDFAAYNLWVEPVGLLIIGAVLRENGYRVRVIDCLAAHPGAPPPRPDGTGKFLKTLVDKPAALAFVPRRFGRYGMSLDQFGAALAASPRPDVIMVSSGMTYWYPGVAEAIRQVRLRWADVPVVLGGTYATLCPRHAWQHSGADQVVSGPGVVAALRAADGATGHDSQPERYADMQAWPPAAHDLVPRSYAALVTSRGCPYQCSYCASHLLQPRYARRQALDVMSEIETCGQLGIRDLAFYDDALLQDADQHLGPILEEVLSRGVRVRFHTPNGLHASLISTDLARLMRRAGFATVRLSLETTDRERQKATGSKVTCAAFEEAVSALKSAGFSAHELGAYVLAGLPGQPLAEVERSIRFAHGLGVQAKIALFSPIPGTPDGDQALPPDADPLLHNNTVQPFLTGERYVQELQRLQLMAKQGNEALVRSR